MYRKIILAFKFSSACRSALEKAIQLAVENDAELLIFHALDYRFKQMDTQDPELIKINQKMEQKFETEIKPHLADFPKFRFETEYFMAQYLKEMGMPLAFIWPGADFTGISPTKELYIDEVIHKTFIEVTESGTEAAATTVVMGMVGSAFNLFPPKPKIFNADHPFIFLIQQKETGNILFLGRVSDPSK